MDLRQREVAEGEADPARKLFLKPLDRPEGLARERTFVVAVLEDDRCVHIAAHVIDLLME